MRSATFPLTFMNLWSIFLASLGDRLEVGRMTLDHATGVRILLPQPVAPVGVIGYLLEEKRQALFCISISSET